jgi:hypothetical protein
MTDVIVWGSEKGRNRVREKHNGIVIVADEEVAVDSRHLISSDLGVGKPGSTQRVRWTVTRK